MSLFPKEVFCLKVAADFIDGPSFKYSEDGPSSLCPLGDGRQQYVAHYKLVKVVMVERTSTVKVTEEPNE